MASDPSAQLSPVWVGDAATREWSQICGTHFWHDCLTWLADHDLSDKFVTRVEVYLLDAPFAKVWHAVRDEHGTIRLDDTGEDLLLNEFTIMLKSLPPAWPPLPPSPPN